MLALRIAYRQTISRQYLPTLFQGNHAPPTSHHYSADAAVAAATGTLLCFLVMLMLGSGMCWTLDVLSLPEFGWRMQLMMGGYERQKKCAALPIDQDSKYVHDSLQDLFTGRYDEEAESK